MKGEWRTIRHPSAIHFACTARVVWNFTSLSGPVGISHSDKNRRMLFAGLPVPPGRAAATRAPGPARMAASPAQRPPRPLEGARLRHAAVQAVMVVHEPLDVV